MEDWEMPALAILNTVYPDTLKLPEHHRLFSVRVLQRTQWFAGASIAQGAANNSYDSGRVPDGKPEFFITRPATISRKIHLFACENVYALSALIKGKFDTQLIQKI